MTTKNKLKWLREGCDPHEDQYLIPVDQARTEDDDLNTDAAVAWINISYSRVRFYNGRGGEGTSRPDAYVAYVRDEKAKHGSRLVTEGANTTGDVGHILMTKNVAAFTSLRAAKQAIAAELAKKTPIVIGDPAERKSSYMGPADQIIEQTCSACSGPLDVLGVLGARAHFRCRNCGLDSSLEGAA